MLKTILKLMIMPVLGLALLIVPLVKIIKAASAPDLATLETPGTKTFQVKEPGEYTVWRKSVGVRNDSEFHVDSTELPPGLTIQIRKADDGSTVSITPSLNSRVTSGNYQKASLVTAELEPGSYQLIGQSTDERVTLVLTKDIVNFKGFLIAFICFGLGLLLLLGGVIYAVFVGVKYLTKPKSPIIPMS